MSGLKPKWRLLAIVLAVTGFLVAFGVALAATVQVSREIGSTVSVGVAVVLPEANLVLSHDDAGTNAVTALSFDMVKLTLPLNTEGLGQRIFIRNDATTALTIVQPCHGVFDGDDEIAGAEIGHLNATIRTLGTEEFRGSACDRDATIAPGETVIADLHICCVPPELAPGAYSFTAVFGALGDDGL